MSSTNLKAALWVSEPCLCVIREMLTSRGFPASTCKIHALWTSFKARAGNWCRKALSQQSVCSLGLDLVRFRAWEWGWGLWEAGGLCCPRSGSRGVHPRQEDGCRQEVKELTVDPASLAPSPAFPGKGQELAASSSEEGVGGDAKGARSSAVTSCTFSSTDFCRPAVQSEPRRQREAFQ